MQDFVKGIWNDIGAPTMAAGCTVLFIAVVALVADHLF